MKKNLSLIKLIDFFYIFLKYNKNPIKLKFILTIHINNIYKKKTI